MRVSARERGGAAGATAGRRLGSPPSPARLARLAPWLATAARLLLGAVWVWAAVAKIADPDASVRAVRAYQLLPDGVTELVGWGLPFLELGLAVLLLAGLATRFAAALSTLLLAIFMVGIASAWARGLRIDCGCFGGGGVDASVSAGTYLRELARDAGLVVVAGLLALWPGSRFALDTRVLGVGAGGPVDGGPFDDGAPDGAASDDAVAQDRADHERASDGKAPDAGDAGRYQEPRPHDQDSEER